MLHVESSLAALAYCQPAFHWIWDRELRVCYALSFQWKKHSYKGPKTGSVPWPVLMAHTADMPEPCHTEGSSSWWLNHCKRWFSGLYFSCFSLAGWHSLWANVGWIDPARSSPARITVPTHLGHPRTEELRCTGVMRNLPSTPFHFFNRSGCDAFGNFLTRYRYKCLNALSFVLTELRDLFRASKETPLIQEECCNRMFN